PVHRRENHTHADQHAKSAAMKRMLKAGATEPAVANSKIMDARIGKTTLSTAFWKQHDGAVAPLTVSQEPHDL
ncbi:MAG: hypothetical protein WBE32_07300, partial [Pseudolabrys sp.]